MSLPIDRDARNAIPLWDGLFSYFPDVWAEVAKVSVLGNKQHNLGAKLFWNREVSTDHMNKVMRHCFDHGTGNVMDTDGTYHMAKAIWRACAELQLAIEARGARGSKLPDTGVSIDISALQSHVYSWDIGKITTPRQEIDGGKEDFMRAWQPAKKRAESY
jgi:hypothetical protein